MHQKSHWQSQLAFSFCGGSATEAEIAILQQSLFLQQLFRLSIDTGIQITDKLGQKKLFRVLV